SGRESPGMSTSAPAPIASPATLTLAAESATLDAAALTTGAFVTARRVAGRGRRALGALRVMLPVVAFGASSFSTFLLDTALFMALTAMGLPSWAALPAARAVSCTANFTINRHVVFGGGDRAPLGRAALQYAVVSATVLTGATSLLELFTAVGLPTLVAKVSADFLMFFVSFTAQRLIVFRARA
ncbi:MAG: GtrA family protein, partial [Brachybacterium sp.]|nr:GtrA family protein [Brachybacterium sp.]